MADLKVCDRCGEYMALGSQDRYGIRVTTNNCTVSNPILDADLCDQCKKSFDEWYNELKSE